MTKDDVRRAATVDPRNLQPIQTDDKKAVRVMEMPKGNFKESGCELKDPFLDYHQGTDDSFWGLNWPEQAGNLGNQGRR